MADNRSQRRPCHAHVHGKDKQRVQRHIQHRAQHGGDHGGLGKALAGDVVIHANSDLHEDGAYNIDSKVAVGIGQGLVACPENAQDGGLERQHPCGDERRGNQQHREAVTQKLLGGPVVLLTHVNSRMRRATTPKHPGEGRHNRDNGRTDADGRHGDGTVLHLTDVDTVYQVVEQGHNLGANGGERQRP